MRPAARALSTLTAAGFGCVAYGCLVERRWYALRRVDLDGALRRPGALTVLHVSDLHLSDGQEHRVAFLRRLAEEDYDLVVATGDLVGAAGQEERTAAALGELTRRGRPGVAVLGSNDLFGPTPKRPWEYFTDPDRRAHGAPLRTGRFLALLADAGYRTLRGEVVCVPSPAGDVALGGFDDPHLGHTVLPAPATVAPPSDAGAVAHLGVVHSPYRAALDVLVDAGHDVLLAGHTHGGQVRLPGVGALTANCDLPLAQARGASRYRGAWLHVSAGLGHSPYAPFRFACRPEASLLRLTG